MVTVILHAHIECAVVYAALEIGAFYIGINAIFKRGAFPTKPRIQPVSIETAIMRGIVELQQVLRDRVMQFPNWHGIKVSNGAAGPVASVAGNPCPRLMWDRSTLVKSPFTPTT